MKKNNLKGSLILCTASLMWGLAFVVQNRASDKVPPFTFNCLRAFIAAIFLFGFMAVMSIKNKEYTPVPKTLNKKFLFKGGIFCGVMLAISTNFQQFGIAKYPDGVPTEARTGFLTALYVIIVPILSLFAKKKVSPIVWCSAVVAVIGFYMLCLFEGAGGFYFADVLVLLCAVAFSLHIILVDKYCGVIGGIRLSAFQFVFCGIVSGALSLIFEFDLISFSDIKSIILEILYMGIVSSGIAYTLQIVGQKYAEPSVASLSMSLESVFAALGGWVISGNILKTNEIIGCLLVFFAIILAQIPDFFKKSIKE